MTDAPPRLLIIISFLAIPLLASGDDQSIASGNTQTIVVTATAYNSVPEQTDDDPTVTAWGDQLEPGMKVIAVSQDLIPLGLDHRAPVSIEGLPGEYLVLDKMNKRWEKRIDIYMGADLEAARAWGARQVRIHW